ncbi:Ig-like domain-containing protein [Candidatus Nitrospira neomarina]|uniref:Ig-like domain-containing protein n=1 Tax=Candidatus Nitrospira neomarina TaxID=3020899 RepID=A0AA96GRH4_9BACT|nr:Ig-like domain-containing protein [Candidatus Nitrospira neomarina]WNM63963.1 Ig-like domain-containing protein [Candidatus Nitrospira neomarina]
MTWDKNSESDLAGYKIYKRTLPSQDFGQPIFSGMPSNPSSPATTVSGLNGGTTYGFIATAFDTAGNESAPSTEKQITLTTTAPPPPSSTLSISNLTVASGKAYVVPTSGLQAGGTVYIDRAYTFTTVPALVQGASYIRTANDDKAATNASFLSFTVNQPVSVYVAHGDRITSKPSWLNTFTDTGTNLVTSDATLSLFVRSFPAGTITLGGNASGGCCSMYSVIVKPEAGSGTSADTTPPTVTLTTPSAGTVSGTVTVSASASDNTGVAGVQFRLQGANLGAEDTTNPYSTSWNTTTVPNGSYTLTAVARDAAGNTTTSASRTVTVSNSTTPPPPPPTSTLNISNLTVASGKAYVVPTSGLQAGGTVYIDRAYTFTTVPALVQGASYIRTANDDKAATNASFLSFTVNQPVSVYVAHGDRITSKPSWLNTFTDTGTNLVTSDATLSLFVRSFPAGTITLGGNASGGCCSMYSVIVKPEAGSGTSADTTPPTVTLTTPSAGTVSGTVTVSASASDNTGVAGVQFRLQGANLGAEDTTNPYSTSWNTTTVPNGSYTLSAIARDAAGNTTTAAPRTVTVSNTSTPPPSSELSISNLTVASGKTYVVPTSGLQAGGTVYIDRAYTFTTVPTSVQGARYIRTANDDKTATSTSFFSFTVNQPVSVFVGYDVRITMKPSWLSTFSDTGTNLVTSDTTLRLFVRSFPAGTITLGGNAKGSGSGSMYSVIVKP